MLLKHRMEKQNRKWNRMKKNITVFKVKHAASSIDLIKIFLKYQNQYPKIEMLI